MTKEDNTRSKMREKDQVDCNGRSRDEGRRTTHGDKSRLGRDRRLQENFSQKNKILEYQMHPNCFDKDLDD